MSRTLRGAAAIAGVGETTYYKRGQSPDAEFKLALMATIAACAKGSPGVEVPVPVCGKSRVRRL